MSIKKPSAVESIYVTTTDITPVKKPSAVNSSYVTTANTTDTTPVKKPSAVNSPQVITDTNPVTKPSTIDSPYVTTDTTPTKLAAAPVAGGGISTVVAAVANTVSANANTDAAASSTGSNVSYYASGIEGIAGLANYGRVFDGANVYVTLEQQQYNTYNQTIGIGNSISVTGNITSGEYFIGNGSQLTGIAVSVSYGNANVVANLAALGSNPVSTTGNVTAGYVIGNGSTLTSIAGANVTGTVANATYAVSAGSATSATTSGTVTTAAQSNITSVGILSSLSSTGNVTGGNILTAGIISATGNITANVGSFFIGNGSQLTGLPATYGNANVVANLAALGSNPVSTTGNVTGGNILTGGLITATGNITGGNINSPTLNNSGNISVVASGNTWSFNTNGTTQFPGNTMQAPEGRSINIRTTSGNAYSEIYSDATVQAQISVNDQLTGAYPAWSVIEADMSDINTPQAVVILKPGDTGTEVRWTFDAVGTTQFPGNVIQAPAGSPITVKTTNGNAYTRFEAGADYAQIGLQDDTTGAYQAWAYLETDMANVNTPSAAVILKPGDTGTEVRWTYNADGTTIFPTLSVQRGDNPSGTIQGQTLLFGDATQEAIISTPDGNDTYINSQRLVINPGQGNGSGEGGDIYLWAGRGGPTSGSGGDVKIRGGQGMNTSGTGGYIRIEGGDSQQNGYPGYIDITGGRGGTTQGAYVRITGGQGATNGGEAGVIGGYGTDVGGDANITAGYGGTNQGGNVNITGGGSALGLSGYGNININAGASAWSFNNNGNLTLPGNTFAVNYANGTAVSLGSSSYGNANVVANLAALGSNPVSTTGNVTGGNLLFGSGIISGTGNITGGNLDLSYMGSAAKGNLTGGNISVTGNITGGNISTAGLLSTGGNVTGGNILTAGAVSASSTITGANLSTGGTVSATGNVAGGNIVTGGSISATGNITSAGNILNQGFVSSTGNAIHGNILTGGLVSATGNITSGNLSVVGTINGSNINLGFNLSATGTVTGSNFNTTGLISAGGNVTVGNLLTAGVISATSTITSAANVTGGNVLTAGLISATGNITGGNISATNHTGTTVSITGNITAGNVINTGISSVTGNITAGNVLTGGLISATGNITTANYFVGNLVGTTVSTTGNVYAGNITVNGQPTTYGYVNGAYLLAQNNADQSAGQNVAVNFQTTSASNGSIITKTSNSQVTLTGGNTYKLEAIVRRLTSSSTWGTFRWYDVTNAAYVGVEGFTEVANSSGAIGSTNVATAYVTPSVNTTYELRQTTVNTISVSANYATIEITQVNPTIAVQATATGTVAATIISNTSPNLSSFSNGTSTSPATTLFTLSIPSAGTWQLESWIRTFSTTGTPLISGGFYTGGTLVANSETLLWPSPVTTANGAGYMSAVVTTASAATYTVGLWSSGTGVGLYNDSTGRTKAQATKLDSIFALNALDTMSLTGNLSVSGNITGGNVLTAGQVSATGNITTANYFVGNLVGTTVSVTGNVSATGNVTAANFFGNGNTLSNVATRFESAWTVPTGNSTQSFTVTPNETYYMWVDCNIPNGILAWNATATVTNTNVPVVGAQYAWVYNGGGTPIDFTSIPNQFTGTANTIVRSSVAPSATTNRFDFGINNTSGNSQTVRYGWTAIS